MKKNLLNILRKTLILTILALLFGHANTQNISNVSIPSTAQSCTGTMIQVDAVQNCINFVYNGTSQSIVGNTLLLNLEWVTTSPICLGALSFIQEDFTFATVPVGVNTVEVRAFLDGVQQSFSTGSFTATSCCPAQASFTSNITTKCTADEDTFIFTNTSIGTTSQEWFVNNVLSSTTQNFSPSFTAASTYVIKLRVTDGTCVDSASQLVTISQSPNVDLGPDIQSCVNQFETLNAGAGFTTYQWSSTATNVPAINITSTGSYNVTVVSAQGCTDSDTINATFNPLPLVNLGNDTAICANTSFLLDAGNFAAYNWNTLETTQTIDASAGGLFSVDVTDANGCENTDDITITLLVSPTVDLGADTAEICPGDSVTLDAGTHTAYNWNTGETSQSISANTSQLYFVTVSNADNCTAIDSAFVEVLSAPVVNLGNDTIICFGQNINFDAGSFASYLWSDNSTMQTLLLDSNIYTLGANMVSLTVTDENACTGTDMLSFEVLDCDTSVGIQTLSFTQEVLIYPNPVENYLLIETETALDVLDLSIVDLSGKIISASSYEDVNFLKLDLENLENGFYFLVLRSGKQMEVRKISKK